MRRQQVESLFNFVMPDLADRRTHEPFMRAPVLGGLMPHDSGDHFCPSLVTATFIVDPINGAGTPTIEVSGIGMRRVRQRGNADEALTTRLIDITFDPKSATFNLLGATDSYSETWEFRQASNRFRANQDEERVRRSVYSLMDPGLIISLTIDFTQADDQGKRISVRIRNEGPHRKGSVLQGFEFTFRLSGCMLRVPTSAREQADIPLYVETVNAVANVIDSQNITLSPYGVWDQNRTRTTPGPTFQEALQNLFPRDLNIPETLRPHFEYAARIMTSAFQRLFVESRFAGEPRYRLFQYDIRPRIYERLSQCWSDCTPRAIVVNTPTATGKSEVNFDAAIVTAIVLKRTTPNNDPGTVAIISEPIRALTAEQLERLFTVLAFVNEQLPENEKVTMGFYMGSLSGKGVPYQPVEGITLNNVPISRCPFCGRELRLDYRRNDARVIPVCDNCRCHNCATALNGNPTSSAHCRNCVHSRAFPWIYLTLKETEDFLPNIVVATVDKLCFEEGRSLNVHTFFGREYVRCSNCGRITAVTARVIDNHAICKSCQRSLSGLELRRSKFSLYIFDEAHSFKGSTGSNAGLYTAAELLLSRQQTGRAALIIATTATVAGAESLLVNLTGANQPVEVFPANTAEEATYFIETSEYHRRFVFITPDIANRQAIPRAVASIVQAWRENRADNDPQRLPQIVFTLKRQEAENLNNTLIQMGYDRELGIEHVVIHGESERQEIESALDRIRRNEIDVVFVTLDLIALGIDIPSISVMHFHCMPDDYAKFLQGYGRSARQGDDNALVLVWLRVNVPGEAYYLVYFRDLFLYKRDLMPIVPINRWFPQSVRAYIPAAAMQYSYFTDQRASIWSPVIAVRRFSSGVFQGQLEAFVREMLSDTIYPEDLDIGMSATREGLHDLINHIQTASQRNVQWTNQLMQGILPSGIRNNSGETTIMPWNFTNVLMSAHVERTLRRAGYSEEDLEVEEQQTGV